MGWANLASTTAALLSLSPRHYHHHRPLPLTTIQQSRSIQTTSTQLGALSPITPTSNAPETLEKYTQLLSWLQTFNNNTYIDSRLIIKPSSKGGYGAFVTSDVKANEVLLRIPMEACVTLNDVTNDVDCGKAFMELMKKAGPGGGTVCLAGYLAKEYLINVEYTYGTSKQKEKGTKEHRVVKHGPYLKTLPWKRGMNDQEHVLFWSEEDLIEYMDGSVGLDDAEGIRSEVKLATKVLNGIIGPSIRTARGQKEEEIMDPNDFPLLPWQKKPDEPRPIRLVDGVEDAVTGAFVSLLTRSFQGKATWSNGEEEEYLVPLLDMLQHAELPNVRHTTLEDGSGVEVRAREDIMKDMELFNQYRGEEEENMPYHRFFTRFGFVPGVMEPVTDLLEERSTIFFPQKEEV